MAKIRTRYNLGEVKYKHKGAVVNTSVGSKNYETIIANADTVFTYDIKYVPIEMQHRPDLLSNLYYGSPTYWWLLMQVNNVSDPFEGFNTNDKILVPRII